MEGRGEEAVNGCIVTADRGYRKESFLNMFSKFGFASVFIMPDHLLRVHPFVGKSYLNPILADLEEELLKQTYRSLGMQ